MCTRHTLPVYVCATRTVLLSWSLVCNLRYILGVGLCTEIFPILLTAALSSLYGRAVILLSVMQVTPYSLMYHLSFLFTSGGVLTCKGFYFMQLKVSVFSLLLWSNSTVSQFVGHRGKNSLFSSNIKWDLSLSQVSDLFGINPDIICAKQMYIFPFPCGYLVISIPLIKKSIFPPVIFLKQFFLFKKKICLFISGCVGSALLPVGFLQLRRAGATLLAVCGLLIVVASLVGEPGLQARGLQQLWHVGLVVVAHRLSCSVACGIFPDQGSNPCPLHWQADSQPLRHQGSPPPVILNGNFIIYQISIDKESVSGCLASLPLVCESIHHHYAVLIIEVL